MTGSAPLDGLLLAALLVAAAVSAVGLLRGRRVDRYLTGRSAETGHLVMNLVMAAMLTPWWAGPVRTLGLAVLAALVVGFAVLLVRGTSRPAHLFHLVAAGAMVLAVALIPGHDGMAMDVPVWQSVAGWGLAVLFLLDALATAGVVVLAPSTALAGGPASSAAVRTLRVASLPHVVMDLGMVAMLVLVT